MDRVIFFRWIASIFVIVETLPFVQGYLFARLWIPVVLISAVAFLVYPRALLNRQTMYLLLYLITICLFHLLGNTFADPGLILVDFFYPLSCLAIVSVFIYNNDFQGLKLVTICGLTVMVISSIFTIPILLAVPNAVRMLVGFAASEELERIRALQKLGIASFASVQAVPYVLPLLVCNLKLERHSKIRLFYLLAILLPFAMLLLSNITTSLLLAVGAIVFCFATFSKHKYHYIFLLAFAFVIFFVMKENMLVGVLDMVQPYFEGTPTEEKIEDIRASVLTQNAEGDVEARSELYGLSWRTFGQNPLLGDMNEENIGRHAFFVDRGAAFGVLGTLPLLLFLFSTFRRHYRVFLSAPTTSLCYGISVGIFVLLGLLKNIIGIENYLYLFVFLPGLCLLAGEKPAPERV